jgi:hypothetical protein
MLQEGDKESGVVSVVDLFTLAVTSRMWTRIDYFGTFEPACREAYPRTQDSKLRISPLIDQVQSLGRCGVLQSRIHVHTAQGLSED